MCFYKLLSVVLDTALILAIIFVIAILIPVIRISNVFANRVSLSTPR